MKRNSKSYPAVRPPQPAPEELAVLEEILRSAGLEPLTENKSL